MAVVRSLWMSTPGEAARASRPDRESCLQTIYRDHHAFVWRMLRRLGVPDASLDDGIQNVFVVVHRRRAHLRDDVPVRSWLYGIVRRVAADLRRGGRRHLRKLQAVPAPRPPTAPDAELARAEAAAFVEAFLVQLDEPQRMAFVLADLEGMSAPEIAEMLDVKLNTVYSRVRLARKRFRRALRERGSGGAP